MRYQDLKKEYERTVREQKNFKHLMKDDPKKEYENTLKQKIISINEVVNNRIEQFGLEKKNIEENFDQLIQHDKENP